MEFSAESRNLNRWLIEVIGNKNIKNLRINISFVFFDYIPMFGFTISIFNPNALIIR